MKQKVSIITPVYNNKEDIITAIKSVISQTYIDWEHIIVDDGSTDGTYDTIINFLNEINDKRIIVKKNDKNIGCYCSINEGILISTGDFITLLGSDDTFVPDKLEKQVDILMKHPECIGSEAYYQRQTILSKNNDVTLLFRKQVIKDIGYYDSLRFGADTEFKFRVIKKYGNKAIIKIEEILYYAKIRPNSLTRSSITGNRDIRQAYMNIFKKWHNDIGNTNSLYIGYPLTKRPFEVDPIMLP